MADALSRPMRIVLVLSLALNLFVAGAVAAGLIMGEGWIAGAIGVSEHRPRVFGLPTPRELHRVLPEQGRGVLEAVFDSHRPRFRERLGAIVEARRAVADAIRAEPFDPQRLKAAFAELRGRETGIAELAQDALVELASGLDAEGRARLAELIARRHGRR